MKIQSALFYTLFILLVFITAKEVRFNWCFGLVQSSMAFCFLFRGCDKSSDQEMAWEAGASNGPSMLFCARFLKTEPLEAIPQPSPSFASLLRQPERKRKQRGRKRAFFRFFFSFIHLTKQTITSIDIFQIGCVINKTSFKRRDWIL